MNVMYTYKFKLKRNNNADKRFNKLININASVWNKSIEICRKHYVSTGKLIHRFELINQLTALRNTEDYKHWLETNCSQMQQVATRVSNAYTLFFSNIKRNIKASVPNFQSFRRYKSITFPVHKNGWELCSDDGHILVMKHWYRFHRDSRKVVGKPKTLTIKRDKVGDLWLFIVVERSLKSLQRGNVPVGLDERSTIGMDFGLKQFLTTSCGEGIISPRFFEQNKLLIKKYNRKLAKKQKGSNKWKQAKRRLAKQYIKLTNQRHNYFYNLARELCKQYKVICLETLDIKSMMKKMGPKG